MIVVGDEYYTNPRPEMAVFLPSNRQRLLEIGCGQGIFASSIPGVTETWAVEPNAKAAEVAKTRLGHVLDGMFEEVRDRLPAQYFDLVICNDVIEHMIDHDRFLTQIKDHIAPTGCLVGSIPNVRYFKNVFELLIERDWHYRDSGTLDRTHLRFFTEKSWRKALSRAGFKVEVMRGINPYMDRWSKRDRIYAASARALSIATLGHFSDLAFLQFGFRASLAN